MTRKPPLDFRPMGADEYRIALDKLGLNVSHSTGTSGPSAAHFFRVAPRTSRNYASGASPIPIALGAFIRLLIASGYAVDERGWLK